MSLPDDRPWCTNLWLLFLATQISKSPTLHFRVVKLSGLFLKLWLCPASEFHKNSRETLERLGLFFSTSPLSQIWVPWVLTALITLNFNFAFPCIVKSSEVLLDSLLLSCSPLQDFKLHSTGQELVNISGREAVHIISTHLSIIIFFFFFLV